MLAQEYFSMIKFQDLSLEQFLNDYWQKKPIVLKQALPGFANPISPDELAGLALEKDIESRIVWQTPGEAPNWHLKRGPFTNQDFKKLPPTHWTLLIQGVDRLVAPVAEVLARFDCIPSWRVDDVMISFAPLSGSVGPHYDNYDVFLYQAEGRRQWRLTTKNCHPENALSGVELRIMEHFEIEEEFTLEEGDMLYLPAHVGHYGISLSETCMTYSFGYRSYTAQELWDSFSDYVAEKNLPSTLYQDPNWNSVANTNEISAEAVYQAQHLLKEWIDNPTLAREWFGCCATRLDEQSERLLPPARKKANIDKCLAQLNNSSSIQRESLCRFAYQEIDSKILLFINGCQWSTEGVDNELIRLIANNRSINSTLFSPLMSDPKNQQFIFELWTLRWVEFI